MQSRSPFAVESSKLPFELFDFAQHGPSAIDTPPDPGCREGAPAPLSADDIDAIVAFLGTLTDAPRPGDSAAIAASPARPVIAR